MHPKRKTIGVRVPSHPVAHALLTELSEPMLSATLALPGDALPLSDAGEIRVRLEHALELVIDAGPCGVEPSTVVDLTTDQPFIVRRGKDAGRLIKFCS
jgi:tRNA A37 threonylcarbamoyladenosine synthetase subunit TsaC/SUA5/YrdC